MLFRKSLPKLFQKQLFYPSTCFSPIMRSNGYKFSIDVKSQKRFQQIRMHTTLSEYPGLNVKVRQHTKNEIKIINDAQTGLIFLVESGGFAGCSDMGICIKLGTQDQNQKNAGSLQCLKSFVHMKPTFQQLVQNYRILHQTGSAFDFNYDALTTYAKCSFLQEDQNLMADLLLDLVLQEKNLFQDNYVTYIDLSNMNELVRRTAFGDKGLGMPGKGIGNTLTNAEFREFQKKITPKNMVISMSNITNPEAFISSIKQKIKTRYPKFLKRVPQPSPKSIYKGGLGKYEANGQFFEFAIAFPSVPSKSQQMEIFHILRVLLGNASAFSSGGPGKGMHSRCTKNLLNGVLCVQKASHINQQFDDFGLFGLTVGGPHEKYQDLIECTLEQFAKLSTQIPEEQLSRAKHILISSIYQNIERQPDRLQQLTKHLYYYNRVKLFEFEQNIRKVTSKQIKDIMKNLMNQKATFVYSGNKPQLDKVPNQATLNQMFKNQLKNVQ